MIRIFDTNKFKSEKKNRNKNIPVKYIDQKRIVDINKLLNRVKINQRREAIKKITFYSLTIFSLSLALILIINIK